MNKYGVSFEFPDDTEKTPLIEADIEMLGKDWYDAVKVSSFVAFGNELAYIILFVLLASFSAYIALIALLSKNVAGVLVYLVGMLGALYMLFRFRLHAKRTAHEFPNTYTKRTYTFYLHHFTFMSDVSAASVSYELVARAMENACGFTMMMNDGSVHYIPKRSLSAEALSMLHSVMVNKFGSKFHVSAL